jgi:tetratricopeptide (TPR) repeat protein
MCFTYDCGTIQVLMRSSDIPDMIVVGVPALDRGYVPTPYENRGDAPTAADLSIKYLEEELIPFIEENFRANNYRILYGHSVGGLFTMYTLFTYPHLFTGYIAGSPWFQNNDGYWLKNIDEMTKGSNVSDKFLFMTVGKEEAQLTIDTYRDLESWMSNNTFPGLTWESAWVEGDHGSMVGRNIYDGLLFIFDGWKIPATVMRDADIDVIDKYLKDRSKHWAKYGFKPTEIIPEQRLNRLGYGLLNRQQYDKAITIFEYNLKLNPKSYNAHDSLAEGYLTNGDRENAIRYYRLAVSMNPGDTERAKAVLANSREKLRELGVNE